MSLTSTQQYFTKLYMAAFNRAPELSGLNYWSNEVLVQGKSLQSVGGIIFSLDIVKAIYPANLTDQDFVEAIYKNVFGRASDAEGLTYWTNEIAALRSSFAAQGSANAAFEARAQLMINMITAGLNTEDGTEGKAFIENRLEIAEFTVEQQLAQNESMPVSLLLDIFQNVNEAAPSVQQGKCEVSSFFDDTAPTQKVSITSATDDVGSIKGNIAINGTTDDASPLLGGTLSAPLALCETLEVYRNGTAVGVATVNGSQWTFADNGLSDGLQSYSVRVVDMAGNMGAASSVFRLTVDATSPLFVSALVSDYRLSVDYNEALNDFTNPAGSSFKVMVNGQEVQVTSADAIGSRVFLTLKTPVTEGQIVTVSYTPPTTSPTEDLAGNDAAAFSNMPVQNRSPSPPVLQTASVNETTLTLTYNEALNGASDPAAAFFTVNVDGNLVTVSSVDANGTSVTLTLAAPVICGQLVTVSYNAPAQNPVEDTNGNDAASFSNFIVSNATPIISTPITFTPNGGTTEGSSDASTAIALDSNWMIVGDDEANVLRVYDRDDGGAAVFEWNYETDLGLTKELDIEASARIDNDTLVFVGSHSNKKSGSEDNNREYIFTVDVSGTGAATNFSNAQLVSGLETLLVTWDSTNAHGFGANYFGFTASSAAGSIPEQVSGFSIEGAAMSLDNSQLLLGFRAPQIDTTVRDKAIVISFNLTTQTIGTAIELDLGGRGIRSIDKAADGSGYLIIAGPAGSASAAVTHDFRLFTWDGISTTVTELDNDLDSLRDVTGGSFETIVGLSSINSGTCVQLLQDNGDTIWPGKADVSKDLPAAEQQFQGNMLKLGNAVNDVTGPILVSATPKDDAINVALNANIVLTFNEGIKAGTGSFTIKHVSDNSIVEAIEANSTSISYAFNTITLNPTSNLLNATGYYVEASATAITDHKGNAWAGISGATTLNFTTRPAPTDYDLLITEVNSNAKGGDFFELYNYGTSAIDLTGWKWDDESADPADAAAVAIPSGTTIAAGEKIIFAITEDASAFRTAWGIAPSVQIIASADPGLGKEDAVVVFEAVGNIAAAFNYDKEKVIASDGTEITTALASSGVTFADDQHAGAAYGGTQYVSAVWDEISTINPTYKAAVAGDLYAYAQIGDAASIGSPGGTLISIVADQAIANEGNSGTTAFTFTVNRTGDTSLTSTADWVVSGVSVDAADFGGALPTGSVSFAAGETSQTITVNVSGDTDLESDESFIVTLSNPSSGTTITTASATSIINDDDHTLISAIQGSGATAALSGTYTIQGVVTAFFPNLKGFFIQEEDADSDGNASTSEGIFVYYNATIPAGMSTNSVGDIYRLTGTVAEYYGATQLTSPTSVTLITDNTDLSALPNTTDIILPVVNVNDFEQYEGMLVNVQAASGPLYASDTYTTGRYGEIGFYTDAVPYQFTQQNLPSVVNNTAYLDTLARSGIQMDDGDVAGHPNLTLADFQNTDVFPVTRNGQALDVDNMVTVGDTVDSITGIANYAYSTWEVLPTEVIDLTGVTRPAAPTDAELGNPDIKVASFNVLNYFTTLDNGSTFTNPYGVEHDPRGANNADEFNRQQAKIVEAIIDTDADVVGLMELQNNGFTNGSSAIDNLVDALNARAGAGTYAYISAPYNDGDGVDEPTAGTDAIMVAIIYKPGAVQPLGQAATPDVDVYTAYADSNRPPVAQTFAYATDASKQFTVVVNHLKSKGSESTNFAGDPDQGDGQGNNNPTRLEAATQLAQWLDTNPTGASDGDYLLIGDFNAYRQEDPIRYLTGESFDETANYGGFTLSDEAKALEGGYQSLDGTDDFSYVFDGLRGSLDHALVSDDMAAEVTGHLTWHINSVENTVLTYDTTYNDPALYEANAYASSDHDPVVIGLKLNSEVDIAPPALLSASVDRSTLTLVWSETLDAASALLPGNFEVLVGGAVRDVTAAVVSSGSTVTLTLASPVSAANGVTVSYLDLTGGDDVNAVQDALGNEAASVSGVAVTNLTDDTAPTLTGSTPADEVTGVARSANIVLTFSENVKAGTGNILIKEVVSGNTFATIAVSDAQVSVSGTQVTINPSSDLATNTNYYVEMGAGVIEDIAGNDYVGLTSTATGGIDSFELDFTTQGQTAVFISELHYDNSDTDANEGVGIMAAAGTDLTDWSIVFYNGNGGASYRTINLTGTVDNEEGSGYGELWFGTAVNGIQNGAPDGLALVNASNQVVQFLSYEGSFTATNGAAIGLTSVDIGVSQTGSTTGNSLQLVGTGHFYEDFTWAGDTNLMSMGSINGLLFIA